MRTHAHALLFAATSFFFLSAFGGKHSTVETQTKLDGAKLSIDFLVKPNKGMKITKEGPWSITLTQVQGLQLDLTEGKYTTKVFDEKLPGFSMSSALDPKVPEVKAEDSIKAFVCTEDKKHCYPQQHKGTFSWKKPS
jgi:hypothetical protein